MLKRLFRAGACGIVGWLAGWVLGAAAGVVVGYLLLFVDPRGYVAGTVAGGMFFGALAGAAVGWIALALISGTRARKAVGTGVAAAIGALAGGMASAWTPGVVTIAGGPTAVGYLTMRAGSVAGLCAGLLIGWVGYEWRGQQERQSFDAWSDFLKKRP